METSTRLIRYWRHNQEQSRDNRPILGTASARIAVGQSSTRRMIQISQLKFPQVKVSSWNHHLTYGDDPILQLIEMSMMESRQQEQFLYLLCFCAFVGFLIFLHTYHTNSLTVFQIPKINDLRGSVVGRFHRGSRHGCVVTHKDFCICNVTFLINLFTVFSIIYYCTH